MQECQNRGEEIFVGRVDFLKWFIDNEMQKMEVKDTIVI